MFCCFREAVTETQSLKVRATVRRLMARFLALNVDRMYLRQCSTLFQPRKTQESKVRCPANTMAALLDRFSLRKDTACTQASKTSLIKECA
jgi:hypothetical protein